MGIALAFMPPTNVARRLRIDTFPAFDVSEPFAFVHPAVQAPNTTAAMALGMRKPGSISKREKYWTCNIDVLRHSTIRIQSKNLTFWQSLKMRNEMGMGRERVRDAQAPSQEEERQDQGGLTFG